MLVGSAPAIDARVPKSRTNRRAGQSGRLHRTDAGDWVWSSDENDSSSSDEDDSNESNDDNLDSGIKKSASSSQASSSGLTMQIVLRMRNPKKELNDIRLVLMVQLWTFNHFLT